jgi:hypothetical protein
MTDTVLFIRTAWKSIWTQNTIWIFSSLVLINQLFPISRPKPGANLFELASFILIDLIYLALTIISFIGVPYLSYCLSINKARTVKQTFFAIWKFSGRVLGCSCLGFALVSPLIYWVLNISTNRTTYGTLISDKTFILLIPVSLFSAFWSFSLFGFFADNSGIWQSIKNAWGLFTAHFGTLAILGIGIPITGRIYGIISGILTVLIQSGFDITSLAQFNYINVLPTLSKNLLFILINGIGQIVLSPLSTSIFAFAYLKYRGVKVN